jgi:hypothetical protein
MTVKLVTFNRTARPKRSVFEPLPQPIWLLNQLKLRGTLSDAYEAWHAWPTLETATFKLARLFGQELRTHAGKPIAIDVVLKAITAFKCARQDGLSLNSAAKEYVSELLKAGQILVTNRIEATGPDVDSEIALWDMTLGPFDDWLASMPEHYKVSVSKRDEFPGEYDAGRKFVAALILTPTDYACLVSPSRSATSGDS